MQQAVEHIPGRIQETIIARPAVLRATDDTPDLPREPHRLALSPGQLTLTVMGQTGDAWIEVVVSMPKRPDVSAPRSHLVLLE